MNDFSFLCRNWGLNDFHTERERVSDDRVSREGEKLPAMKESNRCFHSETENAPRTFSDPFI